MNKFLAFMNKPRRLHPEYRVVGEEMLNIISQLRKDVDDLKQRPVQTHFAEDHENLQKLLKWHPETRDKFFKEATWLGNRIAGHDKDIEQISEDLKLLSEAALLHPRTVEALNSRISATENDLISRIEHLEEAHFKTLSSRISSASWQRPRHKDGRFAKRNGAGDDAR